MLLISTFIFVNATTVNSIVCKNFEDIVYCTFSLIVFTVMIKVMMMMMMASWSCVEWFIQGIFNHSELEQFLHYNTSNLKNWRKKFWRTKWKRSNRGTARPSHLLCVSRSLYTPIHDVPLKIFSPSTIWGQQEIKMASFWRLILNRKYTRLWLPCSIWWLVLGCLSHLTAQDDKVRY